MRRWFRKSEKITAEAARRITGIGSPPGGIQWSDAVPSDAKVVRRFVSFLEGPPALHVAMDPEMDEQLVQSLHEIREQCTVTLQALSPRAFAVPLIRIIRAAARRFCDERNLGFRFFDGTRWHHYEGTPGYFVALGAFRATVGLQVAQLAAHYDIDIEGDLAATLPQLESDAP
jgi:hypothetical protein